MKKTILVLVLLFITTYTFAQTPEWLWAESGGGSSSDVGYAIRTDTDGNIYVTGHFQETASFGSFNLISSGGYDIFIAKMDPNGNWLWAESAGGGDTDFGKAISIDNAGNVYVTGYFKETASFGSYNLTSNGSSDIFVAKMDSNGNWLWTKNAGGSSQEFGNAISTDNAGNVYVTGQFMGTVSFDSFDLISNGSSDIFVAKMDSNGNWLWAESAGGSSGEIGYGISTDDNGNVYVTGFIMGTAYFGSFNITCNGNRDIFVAKMDSNGNWLWAESAGGSNNDIGYGISTDNAGNVYVTGKFEGTASFGSFNLFGQNSDIFVAKLGTNGNWLWVESAGGSNNDIGYGMSTNNDGNVCVTGYFRETATFGSFNITCSGMEDVFVAKIGNNTSIENKIITTINVLSNYPNPFNPTTTISFNLTTENTENIELVIYNVEGEKVKELPVTLSGVEGSATWNGTDENNKLVSSGIYFYKLNVNGKNEAVKKCLLLK